MPIKVRPTPSGKYELCVKHKLLPKTYYNTLDTEEEARSIGMQLEALLEQGTIPAELMDKKAKVVSPLFIDIVRAYEKDPNTRVAVSDKPLLTLLVKDEKAKGLRMSGITFPWVNELIKGYKEAEMAPGTIRKRIGALGKVDTWYHRQMAKEGQQPQLSVLALLPKGYSQYADRKVVDRSRNNRLLPEHEERILSTLGGLKRADRERTLPADPAFELLFRLIVDTGMRLREAYWLRVDQLDVQRGVLRVDGTKGWHGAIKPRTVPLKRDIRERMIAWCKGKTGLVFPFWDGTPEDLPRCTRRLSSRFTTLFEYANVPDFTEHDLRHEACCRWVTLKGERGWLFNETEICKIMGWESTDMLMRYASLRGEDLADRLL